MTRMTRNELDEACGVFHELMQTVRRTAWFYFWLNKEFINTDVEIRICQEYETLYAISRRNSQIRLHVSYDGKDAQLSYWKNFRQQEGHKEVSMSFSQDGDTSHCELVNDEIALKFMIEQIRELMF